MSIEVKSAALWGLKGMLVNVEVDISYGLPAFNIVGLGGVAVKESKDRVRAAINNSDLDFPVSKITVNLSPAHIKKEGSHYDLPIAVGILAATNQINNECLKNFMFLGELSLNGQVKKINGALPIVLEGLNKGISNFIVPIDNKEECATIKGANIYPVTSLAEVVHFLIYKDMRNYKNPQRLSCKRQEVGDFAEVIGQNAAKRAIEVAVSGNHNIIMYGPPGSGKTMLAERVASIMPPLTYEEALEVTQIYSISGELKEKGIITKRPFRRPHHNTTDIALIGGGHKLSPGEVSFAHRGVLFLDEMLEFDKGALEALRQPVEEGEVRLTRLNGTVTYPSRFLLIGAMNLCACGYKGSPTQKCKCSEREVNRYLSKLSGPILDRIDMFAGLNSLNYEEFNKRSAEESSENIRNRVMSARQIQEKRFRSEKINCNAYMNVAQIKRYCKLKESAEEILKYAYKTYGLSNRAYYKILKVARTIADLDNDKDINDNHIIEALQYRKYVNENII